MFSRTYQYKFPISKELLKYNLVGNHLSVRHQEFEVVEQDQLLSIQPKNNSGEPAPNTVPVIRINLNEDGNKTSLTVSSALPVVDSGGFLVASLFSVFFVLSSVVLFFLVHDPVLTISLCLLSILIFVYFLVRLQLGYFNYMRRIRSYIQATGDHITVHVRRQIFKHKLT